LNFLLLYFYHRVVHISQQFGALEVPQMQNVTSQTYSLRLDDRVYTSPDPIVTGQQLLDMAGKRPSDQFLVYQLLQSGQMEGLRPDETVDLRQPGIEKFLTFETDRTFFFTLDGRKLEWPAAVISGRKLKDLAGVDPSTYEVWQEVRGADDRAIGDQELVSLEPKGTERFFTGKKTTTEG
jgi:Multiubiquitin